MTEEQREIFRAAVSLYNVNRDLMARSATPPDAIFEIAVGTAVKFMEEIKRQLAIKERLRLEEWREKCKAADHKKMMDFANRNP